MKTVGISKRGDWLPRPRSKKALHEAAKGMMAILKLMTRSPSVSGPLGITAYIIAAKTMARGRILIEELERED